MAYNSSYLHTTSNTFLSISYVRGGGDQKGTGCKRVPEVRWTRQKTVYTIRNKHEETGPDLFSHVRYNFPRQQSWNRTTMPCSHSIQCEHLHLATHEKLKLHADVQ